MVTKWLLQLQASCLCLRQEQKERVGDELFLSFIGKSAFWKHPNPPLPCPPCKTGAHQSLATTVFHGHPSCKSGWEHEWLGFPASLVDVGHVGNGCLVSQLTTSASERKPQTRQMSPTTSGSFKAKGGAQIQIQHILYSPSFFLPWNSE